jgi:hypothetical protein
MSPHPSNIMYTRNGGNVTNRSTPLLDVSLDGPALRSDAPPPVAIAAAFERVNPPLRARLLRRLLAAVGPLALAVVGGGAFAKYVSRAGRRVSTISVDDAAAANAEQVRDLVRYVQQANPLVVAQLMISISCVPPCDCR